jgi:hypothetical protein
MEVDGSVTATTRFADARAAMAALAKSWRREG